MDIEPAGAHRARDPDFVEGLAKGLAVLECFGAANPDMNLSEIARRVGLSPAAARRSLITLKQLGYVGQAGKRFFLKPRVMSLGSTFYVATRIDELLVPELKQIVETHGDAASIGVLDGEDVIYVAHFSTQRARRATAVVGGRYPAHATSIGRVLLASLPMADFDAYLDRLEPAALTARTVTDKGLLRDIVADVRERGYATTVDQLDYGITALATPIRGQDGRTFAAINSSGYTGMISPDEMVAARLADLRNAASRVAAMTFRFPVVRDILAGGASSGRETTLPQGG